MKPVLYGSLLVILAAALLLAAGCTATSPSAPPEHQALPAAGAAVTGNTSVMLDGVPDVRQAEYYSCGAAAYQAVLGYYGINSFETDLRTMLNTSASHGTYSWDLARVAKQMGFTAEWRENVTFAEIETALRQGNPVIVRSQRVLAPNSTWAETQGIGHYMVAIGFDDKYVYLEDPYILGSRLRMTRGDFIDSWHTYVTEIPAPAGSPVHYHEAVFITAAPPAGHPAYIGAAETHPVVQPFVIQPPIVKDTVI